MMNENVRQPYRDGNQPGRLDINGIEWWACDPYPTWYRWDDEELRTDPDEWMPDDRRTALRYAYIEAERAEKAFAKAQKRVEIARKALEATGYQPEHNVKGIVCRDCGEPIFGGKGDYWHSFKDNVYGSMTGPDGHLAYPITTEE